jgi:hypothetical protein
VDVKEKVNNRRRKTERVGREKRKKKEGIM